MFIYIPTELLQTLCHFKGDFSKAIFGYFTGFIWSLLSMQGRKVVTNIKRNSFFIKRVSLAGKGLLVNINGIILT